MSRNAADARAGCAGIEAQVAPQTWPDCGHHGPARVLPRQCRRCALGARYAHPDAVSSSFARERPMGLLWLTR